MLISTQQMIRTHSLDSMDLELAIFDKSLERVKMSKLLGFYLSNDLKWDEHLNQLLKSCYGTLRTLRKLKHFTDFLLRRHLAESLILSKIDYCDIVFIQFQNFFPRGYKDCNSPQPV